MDKAFEDSKPLLKDFFKKGFDYSVFFDTLNSLIQSQLAYNSGDVSTNVWKLIRLKDDLHGFLRGLERVEMDFEANFRNAHSERVAANNLEQFAEIDRLRAVINERDEQLRSLKADYTRTHELCDALQKQVAEMNEQRLKTLYNNKS